jgi:hypothetical protein
MESDPKLIAFGRWLTERQMVLKAELLSTCAGDQYKLTTIKRKYGQFEAFDSCLRAFTDLYEKDLPEFKKTYLDEEPSDDDK